MQCLLQAGIPVASSCFGDGVCGKCRLIIAKGAENLPAANDTEKFLIETKKLERTERISCQVTVTEDVTVNATYW